MFEAPCSFCQRQHDVTGRYVVAFSGSRRKYWADLPAGVLSRVFDRLLEVHGDARLFVSVGDADGIDALVREACEYFGVCYVVHRAHWRQMGNSAGHERNGRVLVDADVLIALHPPGAATPGTADAIRQAEGQGILVYEWAGRWVR